MCLGVGTAVRGAWVALVWAVGSWGPLTELEVGVVGADVVAGTEQPLHHEGGAHGVEEPEVLGDATLLQGGGEGRRGSGGSQEAEPRQAARAPQAAVSLTRAWASLRRSARL